MTWPILDMLIQAAASSGVFTGIFAASGPLGFAPSAEKLPTLAWRQNGTLCLRQDAHHSIDRKLSGYASWGLGSSIIQATIRGTQAIERIGFFPRSLPTTPSLRRGTQTSKISGVVAFALFIICHSPATLTCIGHGPWMPRRAAPAMCSSSAAATPIGSRLSAL